MLGCVLFLFLWLTAAEYGSMQYPGIQEIRSYRPNSKELAMDIRIVETRGYPDKATAPLTCDEYLANLEYWYNADCIEDTPEELGQVSERDCKSQVTHHILDLEQAYDIRCASLSPTPSTSDAPNFPEESGCGCLDNGEYFNTLVFGNYDSSSNCEGRLAVGGNASMSAFSVGYQLPESNGQEDYLIIKGRMNFFSGRVYGGNIVYGDEGSEIGDNIIHGLSRTNSIRHDPDRVDFEYLQEYYGTLSTNLCSLDDTGEIFVDYGHATTTRGNEQVEILTMTCDDLARLQSIDFGGVSSTESMVINVRGELCDFLIGQTVPNPEYVVWNFCDAAEIRVGSIGVQGSILAPFANVISNSGVVNGQTVTLGWAGQAQQHNVNCKACLPFTAAGSLHPSSSPSPSTPASAPEF